MATIAELILQVKLLFKSAIKICPKINFLNNILEQVPKIVNIDCTKFDKNTNFCIEKKKQPNIFDFILCGGWRTSTPTMENSMEIS